MKKIFFKKNLILKTFLLLFLFISIFLFSNFFYNQNKRVLANGLEYLKGEGIEYEKLKCGREIPVGEAMEKTGKLLEELIRELDSIYENAYYQIKAAEEMIDLANQCDVEKCDPVDCGSYESPFPCPPCLSVDPITKICIQWTTCYQTLCHDPKPCESPWNCHGTYRACPQCQIEDAFKKVSDYYDKIEKSKKEIWALINGTDNRVDRRESLCDKLNEDIRTLADKAACGLGAARKITIIEAIERKLNRARGEFDKCHIPPEDWEKIERGEKIGKYLFSCPTVIKEDFPRYTKTEEVIRGKKIPVCTSPHNWFCCSDMP